MPRTSSRPVPDRQLRLTCLTTSCPACGSPLRPAPARHPRLPCLPPSCPACGPPLRPAYTNRRIIVTLEGAIRLTVPVRRCRQAECARRGRPLHPEAEGRLALPEHEFGL